MNITDILSPDYIACAATPASKKRALEEISELIAGNVSPLSPNDIFESLLSRERLGSTGIGHGVAIPHGRVHNVDKTIGAFLQLSNWIDFDAIDDQPVNLLFALLVPEESTDEHLKVLAMLAEMFNDEEFCKQLGGAGSTNEIYTLLTNWKATTT